MLSASQFGRQLVQTGDLDPIYTMLQGAQLDRGTLKRWCLAYWMFYHAGVASKVAEAPDFWAAVQRAQDEKWPRGTERRHFKGKASQQSILMLGSFRGMTPEDLVTWAATAHYHSEDKGKFGAQPFTAVRERVMRWRGFGPWIAFKVADMTDAVLGIPVDFTTALPYFFDDPFLGSIASHVQREFAHNHLGVPITNPADIMAEANHVFDVSSSAERLSILKDEVWKLSRANQLGTLRAPHAPHRELALQEYETIFCKYKSHLNGKYPVGKDSKEIFHALDGWGDLASSLKTHVPKVPA